MTSADLLVIGRSPDNAEAINSLLRNSGISVCVIHVDSLAKAEEAMQSRVPVLMIQDGVAPAGMPVSAIMSLAEQHQISVAVRCDPQLPDALIEAFTNHQCIALNEHDDKQLVDTVRQQMANSRSSEDVGGAHEKLAELEHRFQMLLNSTRDPIAYIHEGLHVNANRAYLEAMQVPDLKALGGLSILELMSGNEMDLKKLFRDLNRGELPDGAVSVTVKNPSGTEFQSYLTFTAAKFEGEDCIQMTMQERDETTVLKSELAKLRRLDHLTQMINRKTFAERIDEVIASGAKDRASHVVLYLQPDGFERISKEAGIAGSDRHIVRFARIIQACIEAEDLAARFSDHGFAVLVNRRDPGSCQEVAKCILGKVNEQVLELSGGDIPASCSIGVATLGAATSSADEVLSNAISACSEAAEKGNCIVRYKPKIKTAPPGEQHSQWAKRIRYALNNRDLYSVQQSIVNLEGESEGLFESRTFLREEDGERRPDEFMPFAEQHDLGSSIDRHVIPGLLNAISGSGDRHIINVSANSVLDFSFPAWFSLQLDEHDVLGSQIILQITAEAAETNVKSARRLLEELKPRGCQFSIANFNSPRLESRLLEHLEISMIKLETALTQDLAEHAAHQDVIRNIVSAADNKGVAVIADEVQDASDLAILWQCGVKLVAGEFLKEAPQVVGQ